MADVFISYHRSDSASALVRRIVGELERIGISCWYDKKDPQLGDFINKITDEIEQCKIFLLLWDEGANKSRHCIHEAKYAFTNAPDDCLFVPLQIGEFTRNKTLSYCVGTNQIMFDMDELIKKIAAEFGKTPAKIIKRGECGKYGDNVTYTLDENGVLTISGKGLMRNFEWDIIMKRSNAPWWDERKTISNAILKGVTSIGNCVFYDCKELASIEIPDSVASIGWGAFYYCAELKKISIPYRVDFIGVGAFWNCGRLASFKIPDGVTSIKDFTFRNCAGLVSVNIPDSVNYIGKGAFYGCWNLKSVSVPAEAEIGPNAFPHTTNIICRPQK